MVPVEGELALGRKKKKVRATAPQQADEACSSQADKENQPMSLGDGITNLIDAQSPWDDYTYKEMLTFIYNNVKEKNPQFAEADKKLTIKPPQVSVFTSISSWSRLEELEVRRQLSPTSLRSAFRCHVRPFKHALQFLLVELGTTGSIDGNNCVIVKGRFQQKHFETVLRKYISEYIRCRTCRSTETELTKNTRLVFLQCRSCGSRASVSTIKKGFTAVVGRRAAVRRAAEAAGAVVIP